MPPRPKPLRLPLSAFSTPPPPLASQRIEASRTVDAHLAAADVAWILARYTSTGGRKIMGAVGITRESEADPAAEQQRQQPPSLLRTVPVYPIPLPSMDLTLSNDVIDFEVVMPTTLDDTLWDEIDRVLDNVAHIAREVRAGDSGVDGVSAAGSSTSGAVKQPTVVIWHNIPPPLAGLLPPPLPSDLSSTMLPHQAFYQTYIRQLSALALVPGVCLKLLPPTMLETSRGGTSSWWSNEDDLISVLKHFIIPALDSFGSHRLIFGSSSVPLAPTSDLKGITVPGAQHEWYPLVLKLMQSLKLDRESVGDIMAGSAGRVYGLEQGWQNP